eukprot:TRINITY_DN64651_c0_g1_i1.p1 TRINITY_DN64651_c0_g1~~TRINITY_DN64651_c0_g1_i1.p1  ORF type:complete len:458 (+),score=30.26 TRINITY_DN64651_c0_g1_i1:68-1441(+)
MLVSALWLVLLVCLRQAGFSSAACNSSEAELDHCEVDVTGMLQHPRRPNHPDHPRHSNGSNQPERPQHPNHPPPNSGKARRGWQQECKALVHDLKETCHRIRRSGRAEDFLKCIRRPQMQTAGATTSDWTKINEIAPGRWGHSAVMHAGKDIMLVHGGGYSVTGYLNDLWQYSLQDNSWTQLMSGGPGREGHTAVMDPSRDIMWVFGGYSYDLGYPNAVWQYSLQDNSWTSQTAEPGEEEPIGRWEHSAMIDPGSDVMLVFGGGKESYTSLLNDLWQYSLQDKAWTMLLAEQGAPVPSARLGHAAVMDTVRGIMLVFGGYSNDGVLGDLWQYSLQSNSWSELVPAGTKPPAREGPSAVIDAVRGIVLLFGGYAYAPVYANVNDLWQYSLQNNSWTSLAAEPGEELPDERWAHSATIDPIRGTMLVLGGWPGWFQSGHWRNTPPMTDMWQYRYRLPCV